MVGNDLYPRFSSAELERRYGAARALMSAHGIDVLVIFGNSGISRHNHADLHYLSGFLGNRNNYLVFPARGGHTINDGFLHGFAIGLMPPSIGMRQAKRGVPKPPFRFERNMCVVVQPNVVTHDQRAGVQLGNLFRITADGAECLHRLPLQYYTTE